MNFVLSVLVRKNLFPLKALVGATRTKAAGFSLVELLTVMVIIGLMATLAVSAVSSIVNLGRVNQVVSGTSLLLDEARAYAMAHQTFVWVGFQSLGSQKLAVGMVAGLTGDASDLTLGKTVAIENVATYDHMALANLNGLSGMASSSNDISTSQVSSFQQSAGGITITFPYVLQFNPQGEVAINSSTGSSHWIKIGLQPILGNNTTNPDIAVIQVTVLTGQVQVFRP